MNRKIMLLFALAGAGIFLLSPLSATPPNYYNGVSGVIEANEYDAPIWRQFSFVEGDVATYQVLSPELFLTDAAKSVIYQFPMCETLAPVLPAPHLATMPDGQEKLVDSPTRRIVDVILSTGCSVQPTSEADIDALALVANTRPLWVNAPVLPKSLENLPTEVLFNAPPYRPLIDAYMDGEARKFMTYEANWFPNWVGNAFPNEADVYILSAGPLFRPGFTLFNSQSGVPLHETARLYSPIWKANCIVDWEDRKCMLSVNAKDHPYNPTTGLGYYQCKSITECLEMKQEHMEDGEMKVHEVVLTRPNVFTHINCPIVAIDLNKDGYVDSAEELVFPDLWLDGPVVL